MDQFSNTYIDIEEKYCFVALIWVSNLSIKNVLLDVDLCVKYVSSHRRSGIESMNLLSKKWQDFMNPRIHDEVHCKSFFST